MWINREILPYLQSLVRTRPSILLTGARQTGKTSILRTAFPHYPYVTLDVPLDAREADENGDYFLTKHGRPLIIDEIQYAPNLLRNIKISVDAQREEKGQYLLTGSQKFGLMQGVSESLAGRIAILELYSLSLREIAATRAEAIESHTLLDLIVRGGYPEVYLEELVPARFYADYFATYLERDVRQALAVRDLRDFDRFVRSLATRSGQLLSLNSLASDLGISPHTAKSWLSVLEASTIVALCEPWFGNVGKRLIKTPKCYFLDTGLLCYLLGIHEARELERSSLLGPVFETLVFGQLIRSLAYSTTPRKLYFYRDNQGLEIDFVIPQGDSFHLIECKWAENPQLPKTFGTFEKLVGGPEKILSRRIVCSKQGQRYLKESNLLIVDAVDPLPNEI